MDKYQLKRTLSIEQIELNLVRIVFVPLPWLHGGPVTHVRAREWQNLWWLLSVWTLDWNLFAMGNPTRGPEAPRQHSFQDHWVTQTPPPR